MRRFVNDDAGYLAWLPSHRAGFVLNTFPHVTASYLVLHRSLCRTINRPLAAGRNWTYQYGKSCSDDRAELEEWARRKTGKSVKPCGICIPGEAVGREESRHLSGAQSKSHGSRAPKTGNQLVLREGDPIRIVVEPAIAPDAPRLVIEGAQWLAETFFSRDPSAVGQASYDFWIEETQRDPERRHRIVDGDVTSVNTTMAARTAHETWAPIINSTDWSWLEALDPGWDLFGVTPADWAGEKVARRLTDAFNAIQRPGLGIAVTTKVLHVKRPRLIPVLDSLVIEQLLMRTTSDVSSWVAAIEHIRRVGQANLAELEAIREHLRMKGIADRTLVRILDALLWTSNPRSGLFSSLSGWERAMRPSTP